jgi:superfamily II DNA or RNA helicase
MMIHTTLQVPLTAIDGKHTKLLHAYNGLTPLNQTIVHILAVIYYETARTHIVNSLKKLTIQNIDFKKFTVKNLDPILTELVDLGLVESSNTSFRCCPLLLEPLCRMLVEQDRFHETAAAVQHAMPVKTRNNKPYFSNYEQMVVETRIGLYRRDADYVRNILSYFEKEYFNRTGMPHPYAVIFKNSFDSRWILGYMPRAFQADIAKVIAESLRLHDKPVEPEIFSFLKAWSALTDDVDRRRVVRAFLAERSILEGRLHEAEEMISGDDAMAASAIRGFSAFLSGMNRDAISHYETALAMLKKSTRKRKIYFDTLSGLFYILALLKSGTPQDVENAKTYALIAANDAGNGFQKAFRTLCHLIEARRGNPGALESIRDWIPLYQANIFSVYIQAVANYWMDKRSASKLSKHLEPFHEKAVLNGQAWLAAEYSALLSRLPGNDKKRHEKAAAFFAETGIQSMIDLIQPESKWQQALNALIGLKRQEAVAVETDKASRMVWLLDVNEKYRNWSLSPREQVRTSNGAWTKGRKIALKRLLYEAASFDFLTPQDRAICACIEEDSFIWRGYPEVSYHFNAKALKALIGHPLVFAEDSPEVRMEVIPGRPELLVSSRGDGRFEISMNHYFGTGGDVQPIRESPTRIRVIETGDDVIRIAKIIGKGISVPASGKTRLLEAVESVSPIVTVHSQIDGVGRQAEETPADPTPGIHLRPLGAGLKLEVLVQPFAAGGPCFRPGEGGKTVISDIDGKLLRTNRDLDQERRLAEKALTACPMLASLGESIDALWEWKLAEPEDCLEVLLELKALEKEVIVKWPEGEKFRIRQQADINRFFMSVNKQKDWFSVSGELKLDDGLVLSMDRLLSLLENAPGRFVPMEDGQFLALTREFRKRLDELSAYSKKSGDSRRFHPLAALSLEEMADELGGFRADAQWKAHLKRLNDARALKPEIPSTFKAELRDYQIEGFRWLARLSHWGVGACLADDMGLGKTIQALAVMLTNASKGPCLVVAPTSVCMNWEAEAHRFAPSFTIVTLGNDDREEILNGLKPFDLLVIGYGLLQQEKVARMLSCVHFTTIVLDEAQAIKNLATKRSQAAMNLGGDFRLITTGTPIENHLGELWNLFNFINPGLLGSLEEFNETFAVPIEKNRDRSVQRRLKKLVSPYILRRVKNQVLEELPQRTDILLQVELSTDELAFYEALRRKALEHLTGRDAAAGNIHLRILAEIMKLRRACCNTRLVMPDVTLPSAKLAVFGDIVQELLENGHKALVFSQFTGHLEIIREYVENRGIRCQYLDGSTPQKERKKRVDAFQGGEGDLFLISLKAGGLGLNLTAADYVIHMDPWWNPAVEDQASDRAHRIGQKRPVTVYRLIARHTIEEKIVGLHKTKRALADSLLDGADMSGKMTADELLRLIREA